MLSKIRFYISERRSLFLTRKRANEILSNCRLFFITGMGRSGTKFLTKFLDDSPETAVYHESYMDYNALIEAYYNPEKAFRYLNGLRRKIIADRIHQSKCQLYGEVNSLLRYHVKALRQFDDVKIFHLVRDGRLVVRSIMNRRAFTPEDNKHSGLIKPLPGDLYLDIWHDMDRFEKICLYWSSTCRYLLEQKLPVIRLEDLINSFEKFERQVLRPLQVQVSYERWKTERNKPKNVSKSDGFPKWEKWSDKQQYKFQDICGDVMADLGYEI